MPQQPQISNPDGQDHCGSSPMVLGGGPVALAAQSVVKSGALKKRSKNLSGVLWQQRFIVIEGPPTHLLVYYYPKAAAAEGEGNKPRGVLPLSEVKAETYDKLKDGTAFRVRAPKREYEFRAASPEEARAWIAQINKSAAAASQQARAATAGPAGFGAIARANTAAEEGELSSSQCRSCSSEAIPSASDRRMSEESTINSVSFASSAAAAAGRQGAPRKWGDRFRRGGGGRPSVSSQPSAPTLTRGADSWCDITLGGNNPSSPVPSATDRQSHGLEEIVADESFGQGAGDPAAAKVSASL